METIPLLVILLIGVSVVSYGAWFIWKKFRLRLKKRREETNRRFLEDTLKVIFNLEKIGQTADQYRLAVELDININRVKNLVIQLTRQDLISVEEGNLSLTTEGRRYATQVIRAHRLWERYLADEARMPLNKIHAIANKREHEMDVEEVDNLDAAMGFPVFDPHGDPIPSAAGRMRDESVTTPLTELEPGQRARIVHLEDEPPVAYEQLLAEGLYVGQNVVLDEKDTTRIVLTDDVSQYILARAIAENVHVVIEKPKVSELAEVIPLSLLAHDAPAEVVNIDNRCQGFTRRRFLDLGLTPGTIVTPELKNAFKDPRGYRLRGTLIALRFDQADLINVRPLTLSE